MPVLPSSPSDFTATVKSAAVANAAVGGASLRPSKNSGGYVSLGALGAIVTQSVVARATISQRFDPDLAPAPAPIIETITLNRSGTRETYIVKYNTNGTVQWARRINGQGNGWENGVAGKGQNITTDSSGNIYVIGTYTTSLTVFGSDNTTAAAPSFPDRGFGDVYIAKYNSDGIVQWARRIAGTSIDQGNSIKTDSSGNVYIAGLFVFATLSAYDASGNIVIQDSAADSQPDGFILKYNSSGTPLWLRKISTAGVELVMDIAVDSSGNVFACGYSNNATINFFGVSPSIQFTLSDATTRKGFIAKYDTNGTPLWGRVLSRNTVIAYAIATDSSGNAYVLGSYNDGGIFTANGGSTSVTLPSTTETTNAFLVKYDTNGEPQWARALNGTNTNMFFGISVDSSNNAYIVGRYSGTLVIRNANDSPFLTATGPGTWDIGVVKYGSDGTPQWLRRIGGSGTEQGLGVASDSSGNVYVVGSADNSVIVFDGAGTAPAGTTFTTLTNSGSEDAVLVKYNTSGTPLWATRISGSGSDVANSIALDTSGNPVVIGSFTSNPLTLRTTGF